MKLLMLAFNQVSQGTYWRAFYFARELVRRGHQVTLIATSRKERLKRLTRIEEGVEVTEMPDLFTGSLRSGWDPWNTLNRLGYLRGQTYDLVHAFESRPTVIFPALFLHNQGIPLVMDWADWFGKGGSVEERPNLFVRTLLRPVETFFEEHYRGRADGMTVICSLLHRKAVALGVSQDRIRLIRNGADISKWKLISVAEARVSVGLPQDVPVIGYVGSIFPKDARLMIAAFEILIKQLPDVRLVIAGYCPYNIRSAVSRPEKVIQTGFLDSGRLNEYLSASDVCWLPLCNSKANQGRFPYKLTDYMALGRPVVATSVGDVPQILEIDEIGLLSPARPESFANLTIELLSSFDRRQEMGHRARLLAESRFSWEIMSSDLEDFYQEIVACHRHHN